MGPVLTGPLRPLFLEGQRRRTENAAVESARSPADTPRANPIRIVVVVVTRPEAVKLVPIILALRESESFHPIVVSTGQHHEMVSEVFELAASSPTSSSGSATTPRRA